MDYLIRRLGSEYPDITIIQDIYRCKPFSSCANMVDEDFLREMSKSRKDVVDEGDHKYRPLALVLAVLYRCNKQEIFWQKIKKK